MDKNNIQEKVFPINWVNCILGEVVDYGKTQKIDTYLIEDDTWVLELEDIEKHSSKIIQKLPFKVRQSKSTKNIFKKGDVLYGKLRPYLNKVVIADDDGVCSSEIIPIKCDYSLIDRNYLFFWLKSSKFLSYVNEVSYGVNMPRLGTKDGKNAPFPLAPLAEQKRIVEKLDSLLGQVETIQQRLEHLPDIIKRFRQSVLAAAVSGKLTEEWRKNNDCSFNSDGFDELKEIEYKFQIPNSWLGVNLGAISEKVSVGHVGKTTEFYTNEKNGIPFLRSQNVRQGYVSKKGLTYITKEFHKKLKKSQLQKGDLMIVRVGANRGDACILGDLFEEVNCANIVFARPDNRLSSYLNIYFQSPIVRELLLGVSVGGAQGVINTKSIYESFLALPPLEEQTEIVRLVEKHFALADTLETHLQHAKQRIDKLTQSILAKAFKGELVPQDPNDEPAEKLLERIKTARAEAQALEKAAKKAAKAKK